jgi:type IV pilus assembly protein PilY1
MNPIRRSNIARFGTALLLCASVSAQAERADDTEIYLDSGSAFASDPIVMFFTEYSQNLAGVGGDAGCGGFDISALTNTALTTAQVTTALKDALAATCNGTTQPDFRPLTEFFVYPDSPGASKNNHDFHDRKLDRYELIRAAMKRVILELGGMKIGVIASHKDDASCSTGPSVSNCSNGAYIFHQAVPLRNMTNRHSADGTLQIGTLTAAGLTPATFVPTDPAHIALVLANDANKAALFKKLNSVPAPQGNFSAAYQDKEVYFELFRYLTGKPVFNGHNGWNDYYTTANDNRIGGPYNLGRLYSDTPAKYRYECATDFTCDTTLGTGEYAYTGSTANGRLNGDFVPVDNGNYISSKPLKWDTLAEDNGTGVDTNVYDSPIDQHCQRIFAINLVYSKGTDDDSNSYIAKPFSEDGVNMVVRNQDEGFVDMVQNLRDYDLANGDDPDPAKRINPNLSFVDKQNVTSFFLAGLPNQLDAAASAGGTGRAIPLSSDASTLINDLQKVFNQILSVSTTFVAASIPVNVFNRSEVIDNAYIALFQADADSKPAWMGDVKKLKLDIYVQTNPDGSTVNKLQFIDANSVEAIAPDGRIDAFALTFWTNGSGYDITDPTNVTGNDPPVVPGKDGRAVTRGGAGQKIPGFLSGTAQGSVSWYNAAPGGRRLFTDDEANEANSDALPAGSKLMNIEWANRVTLWPSIRDHNDPYSVSLWPTNLVDDVSGLVTPYTGQYDTDQDLHYSASGCYSYYNSTSTSIDSGLLAPCWVGDIASNVIAFMRGYDVNATGINATAINTARVKTRRWIMGDPLHSRPLPINFGAQSGYEQTNPDIRILFGSNDGYLRMLKNTGTGSTDTNHLGTEVWAFMPREVMKTQKQLMDNLIVGDTSPLPKHAYGVDGSPVAYVRDSDGTIRSTDCATVSGVTTCDVAWVYFGLRRGGRAYYALNITNPDSPKFMWKKTNASPGFSELGYTFSQPVVRHMNWGSGSKPVLIFAGGHDLDKDIIGHGSYDDPATPKMGRAIYIVDAETGYLVWKVTGNSTDTAGDSFQYHPDMVDSIPSEVTATDGNGDGLVDRIYVGDSGGKVWRIDLPGQTTSSTSDPRSAWEASVLMNLGRHWDNDASVTDGTYPNDRRFFSAPDVVPARDDIGNYDAIVIGSGNREHPLGTLNEDYMYMYKDRCITQTLDECNTSGFAAKTPDDLADLTTNCAQTSSCSSTVLSTMETGWMLKLTDPGEKSLSAALTLRGVVYFSTYVPSTTLDPTTDAMCKPEGKGYFYAVSLEDATSVFSYFSTVNETGDNTLTTEDRKRELASGGIPSENVYVSFRDPESGLSYTGVLPSDLDATPDLGTMQWRSFWYEKQR